MTIEVQQFTWPTARLEAPGAAPGLLGVDTTPWVLPTAEGAARLVFADPPYNIGARYADDPTGDRLRSGEYREWVLACMCNMRRMLCSGGTLWWLAPAEQLQDLLNLAGVAELRLLWGTPIVVHETFAQYQQGRLTCDYRVLLPLVRAGESAGRVFNGDAIREQSERQRMGDKRADPRGRVPGRVWRMRRLQGTAREAVDWHPNQLCPELLERIVLGWSREGELVVDAFAGTGSMGLVCQKLNRRALLLDRSSEYCRRMAERLGFEEQGERR